MLVQSADHITGLTGASPTVTISKAGGTFAAPSGAVTEIANGWYKVAANATDSNTLGPLLLHATATSGDPTDFVYEVVAYDPQVATAALNLAQALSAARALDSVADTSLTINDALHCAVACAVGQETIVGTAYTIKTPSTATVIRTFVLDSTTAPTSRT